MFRQLTEKEIKEFRQWARDNYSPATEISKLWHPVVQAECRRMREQSELRLVEVIDNPPGAESDAE